MIRVVCPGCGKGIKAPESMEEEEAKCPGCDTSVVIKQQASPTEPATKAVDAKQKPCPHCREMIKEEATRCKHCHGFILILPTDEEMRAGNEAIAKGCVHVVLAIVVLTLALTAVFELIRLAG